jgi:hypothetical protein
MTGIAKLTPVDEWLVLARPDYTSVCSAISSASSTYIRTLRRVTNLCRNSLFL